jgi:hypothetical protein
MLQFASDAAPRGSIVRVRGVRALGEEAPLRSAIEIGERLLVCASVRFAGRSTSQPLWLTDRRFIFTRRHGRMRKLLVSVPIASSALDYVNAAPYPLQLTWIGADGKPSTEAFRAYSWKDAMRSEGSAGAAGGVTAGVVGAIVGVAVDAAIKGAVGDRGVASRDQRLYSMLAAAQRAPGQVRPVDLTAGSLNTPGGRWLILGFTGVVTALFVAAGVFGLVNYQAKQAYEVAPICGLVAGPDCRLLEEAVVTGYRGAGGRDAYCDLFLIRDDGSTVEADLHTFSLCANDPRGQHMFVEYWRRSLTGVIPVGAPTRVIPTQEAADNPEYKLALG